MVYHTILQTSLCALECFSSGQPCNCPAVPVSTRLRAVFNHRIEMLSQRPNLCPVPVFLSDIKKKAFSITSDVGANVVGCGLYIQASTANHSCRPNAAQSFNGRTLALRCTRPVLKGEEITLGITELHRPRASRRQALRESYFFECQCERCASDDEAAAEDARLNGYSCPTASCTGVCKPCGPKKAARKSPSRSARKKSGDRAGSAKHPVSEAVASGPFLCDTCGASRPAKQTEREEKAIRSFLERGKAAVREGRAADEGKESLEEACQRAAHCLHGSNWLLSEIYSEVTSVCLEVQVRGATESHGGHDDDVLSFAFF